MMSDNTAAKLPSDIGGVHAGPVDTSELRTIEVTVDPYNAIPEGDEGDNVTSQRVDVAALRAEPIEVSVMR